MINPSHSLRKGTLAPYVEMAELPTDGHQVSGWYYRNFSSGRNFITAYTSFVSITRCLENGKTGFVIAFLIMKLAGGLQFIVLRRKLSLPPYFGYLLARRPEFRAFAIQSMSGTSGRQNVQVDRLAQYTIVLPMMNNFDTFGVVIEPSGAKITAGGH